jgi:hypothetical protein
MLSIMRPGRMLPKMALARELPTTRLSETRSRRADHGLATELMRMPGHEPPLRRAELPRGGPGSPAQAAENSLEAAGEAYAGTERERLLRPPRQ